MWHEIAVETGKSLWREVGEDVVKKGAAAVVVEGTKALLDIWKRRRIRQDEWEFKKWKEEQEGDSSSSEPDVDEEKDEPEQDEPEIEDRSRDRSEEE